MKVTVLFFATIKTLIKVPRLEIELEPGSRVSALLAEIAARYPDAVTVLNRCLVAVNQQYTSEDVVIPPDAEIAIFPPVSGGSDVRPTFCKVTDEPLDLNEILSKVTEPSIGAVSIFTGIVRGTTSRGTNFDTEMLEYEAYIPMAEKKELQVAAEMRERWPDLEGIAIVQRIGNLTPGTIAVIIAVATGHRDQGGFEAARYAIYRLKEIVPVWKKEIGTKGEVWVEGDYHPGQSE